MRFLSDNAAPVHPQVLAALAAADEHDQPYDGDRWSAMLDERFSDLFGRECSALWVATGTAANCLALSTLVQPHGAVVCHEDAHIEVDEGGAPGFYLHGAKLILARGDGALMTPADLAAVTDGIREDVHQVQPHAIAITQASEYGRVYDAAALAALGEFAKARGLGLHMDGARFANAVAYLDCPPAEAVGPCNTLAFGFIKNGGMSAEALVLFDVEQAQKVRYLRKRAGHLQCKGRYLAAQILAMLEGDLWLKNARHANAAAAEIASACADRLLHRVEANELFVRMSASERDALRAQGFEFYDWGEGLVRFVTAWDTPEADASKLAAAIANR